MPHSKSPEQALVDAQQEAADDLAVCALEHAAKLGRETMLSSAEGKNRLLAQAAALLAYAYVDFCERYGGIEPEQLRAHVTTGVQIFAPALSPGGKG